MRIRPLQFAALLSIASTVCLGIPSAARSQRSPRPAPPVAPLPPFAPLAPLAPLTPLAPLQRAQAWTPDDFDVPYWVGSDFASNFDFQVPFEELDKLRNSAAMLAIAESHSLDFDHLPRVIDLLPESPPAPWAKSDPADSLYRIAREALNAGEYRHAADLFAQITRQYPKSQYHFDAAYWRAFALYRIGGIADLHEALRALDSAGTDTEPGHRSVAGNRTSIISTDGRISVVSAARSDTSSRTASRIITNSRAPNVFFYTNRSSDAEAAVLATRIRGALAARGDATAAAAIARTADGSATSCDEEDAQVRVEALNALVQMDPKNADPAIAKVLARRDSCAAPLRRGALALIARSDDAHNTDLLVSSARTDPSIEVRAEAIRLLGRTPDDRATTALTAIATSSDKAPLQRIAVRALASQQSPASIQAMHSLMTRTDLPPDVRITALHYAGKNDLQVADLTKIYDASSDRSTREEIISLLTQRDEPQAADKLFDIARTSTDPAMRRRAISALSHKKDPRTTKLLMDILDK